MWVIEGGDELKAKLPFHKTDLDVKIVDDMQPYRTRKVRILNGAHTTMVPFSLLYGNTTVKETVDNSFTGSFINAAVFEEIIETLQMDRAELNSFADEVLDRFRNPFIKHKLADIALNSISKFKVRVLPSILEYINIHNKLPKHLIFRRIQNDYLHQMLSYPQYSIYVFRTDKPLWLMPLTWQAFYHHQDHLQWPGWQR